jgi:hypothetical protein
LPPSSPFPKVLARPFLVAVIGAAHLSVQTHPSLAAWHASAGVGLPNSPEEFAVAYVESPAVGRFAIAHRGTGSFQPRFAVLGGVATGVPQGSWPAYGATPKFSLSFAAFMFGGELATKHRNATLAISPTALVTRWDESPYGPSWLAVTPAIAVEGSLHIPLVVGLDLEPGLALTASGPIFAVNANQGNFLQVLFCLGLGF